MNRNVKEWNRNDRIKKMIMIDRSSRYLIVSCFILTGSSLGITPSVHSADLFDLPLEELMKVSIVSQQEEAVITAPAIVSSYSRREMEQLGLYSLKDIIDFVPGIQVNEDINGNTPIQVRGLVDSFNQKILFLLNGVPYWMPSHGEFPLYGIPFESIEKLEIIRGPGSVIYGTNASAGVINIVTRKSLGSTFAFGAGKNDFYNGSLYHHQPLNDNYALNISAEIQEDGGYDAEVKNAFNLIDEATYTFSSDLDGSLHRSEEHSSLLFSLESEQLKMMAHTFKSDIESGADGSFVGHRLAKRRGDLFSGEYLLGTNDAQWKVYGDINRYFRELPTENITGLARLPGDGTYEFDEDGDDNIRRRGGVNLRYTVNADFLIYSGVEYEDRKTANYRFKYDDNGDPSLLPSIGLTPEEDGSVLLIPENQLNEKAVFLELSYQFDKWSTRIGDRYIDNSYYGSQNAPSANIVYQWNDQQSLKLVYNVGFNSPTFLQSSATDSIGRPIDTDVGPELIKTWDLAYTYSNHFNHFVINGFNIRADDLIQSAQGTIFNTGLIERNGFEVDYQYRRSGMKIFSSYGYLHEGNRTDEDDITAKYAAKHAINIGASYRWHRHIYGASLRHVSERADVSSYQWLNLAYNYVLPSYELFANIGNALGQDIFHPDVGSTTAVKMQATEKYQYRVGVKINL